MFAPHFSTKMRHIWTSVSLSSPRMLLQYEKITTNMYFYFGLTVMPSHEVNALNPLLPSSTSSPEPVPVSTPSSSTMFLCHCSCCCISQPALPGSQCQRVAIICSWWYNCFWCWWGEDHLAMDASVNANVLNCLKALLLWNQLKKIYIRQIC